MANPTLITGFEDVMTYIRQQDERIKRLEEENKKLKKENKEYEFESCESVVTSQKVYGQAFAIQAERDKLQEEKKTLALLVKSADDFREECIKGWRSQVEKLTEENEHLKEDIQQYKDTLEEHFVHYDNLKEENKKLKETCEVAWKQSEKSVAGALEMSAELYELKEENKKVRDFAEIIAELATMIENIDQNACDVFNKLTEKYRDEVEELKCSK